MYLALNGSLVARRLDWPALAETAARVGYEGVDVFTQAIELGASTVRLTLDRLRLKPAVTWLPVDCGKDDAAYRAESQRLESAAQFAAAIGCPRMTVSLPSSTDRPRGQVYDLFHARLTQCAALLLRHGIRLGLEFLSPLDLRRRFQHEFIWRMDDALQLALACGPNVGLTLDAWHWHHAGSTVEDIIAARGRIVHVHVADAPALPPEQISDRQRLMPGEGVIALDDFFRALARIGYDGPVSPEVFGRGLEAMTPDDGARLGLESTRAVMNRASVL